MADRRPAGRIAGHKAGKDNVAADPPNAAPSVYEAGQANNTLPIVEILESCIEGKDPLCNYKLVSGTLPAAGA